ncbi:MAG: biotin/lipoyl-binding protein [Planctomycetia bacterium]|nr:biotin/lipoyl-binding protein [Planctomycetia bacterium]
MNTYTTKPKAASNASKLLHPPYAARFLSWLLLLGLLITPGVLSVLPWQQNFYASGRMIAFDPEQRQQDIEAPVDGRISKWYVTENQRVKAGQRLVSIQDPDPDILSRLAEQKRAIMGRQTAARERETSFKAQVEALKRSKQQALDAAANRVQVARETLRGATEAYGIATLQRKVAEVNFRMEKQMRAEGLTSQLVFVQAEATQLAREAEERRANNAVKAAQAGVDAADADREKIRNDADASIQSATASIQSAQAEAETAARELADLEIRISRQSTQEVVSPVDGNVFRIVANASSGGSFVKAGDRLMIITPEVTGEGKRVVELFVEGNDAPQLVEFYSQKLKTGSTIEARIQFEGYPAIQFVGWPSIAVGTFGGKVMAVDAHDDGKGKFRVLIEHDENDKAWPSDFALRQGSRAQGWLLLEKVSLGYELWRRFNAFPPVMADKDESPKKPTKVKVPK